MPVQKIQAGRVLNSTVDTFVGQHGTLFYDETTGQLRLSNGVTPGGISILSGGGNFDGGEPWTNYGGTNGIDAGGVT